MGLSTSPRLLSQLNVISKIASLISVAIGGVTILGWIFNIPSLKSILPEWIAMATNTAICFLFLGIVLWIVQQKQTSGLSQKVAYSLIMVVALLGILNLIEYIAGLNIGIDQLIFKEALTEAGSLAPNRMALTTALDFILLSFALYIFNSKRIALYKTAQIVSIVAFLIGLLTLIVYIYGVAPNFDGLAFYTQMAINTACCFMILSLGVLLVKPEVGFVQILTTESLAGILIRRMLPMMFLITIFLEWLILWGEQQKLYDARFGICLFVFLSLGLLSLLIVLTSGSIYRIEKQREHAQSALKEAENEIDRAVMANLRKDESLANTSHELRSPLQGIIAGSSMLLQEFFGPLNDKQKEYLGIIKNSGEHLLQLINDLLDIAKIDAGKLTIDIKEINLQSFIEETFKMVEPLGSEKNQMLIVQQEKNLPVTFQSDPVRLKQILCNLISNAIKFTPEEKLISLRCFLEEPTTLVFVVIDEGPGISESDLEKIFKPYEQGDQVTLTSIKGTGLGLFLVQKLVHLLNGNIQVQSQVGQGSQFSVSLPLSH